jgi:hypothetical protein
LELADDLAVRAMSSFFLASAADSPLKAYPRDLATAHRELSQLHKELLEVKAMNYELEKRNITNEHVIVQLRSKLS